MVKLYQKFMFVGIVTFCTIIKLTHHSLRSLFPIDKHHGLKSTHKVFIKGIGLFLNKFVTLAFLSLQLIV